MSNNYIVAYVNYYKEISNIDLNISGEDYFKDRARYRKLKSIIKLLYQQMYVEYNAVRGYEHLFNILEPKAIQIQREAKLNYLLGDTE